MDARRGARVAFVAYLVALAVLLLNPSAHLGGSSVTFASEAGGELGLPSWLVRWDHLEIALNVAALVPLSVLGMVAWPQTDWAHWTAYGFVISVLAEGAQALLLPGRSAAYVDVVANTGGALVGGLVMVLWRSRPGGSARRGPAAPARGPRRWPRAPRS